MAAIASLVSASHAAVVSRLDGIEAALAAQGGKLQALEARLAEVERRRV